MQKMKKIREKKGKNLKRISLKMTKNSSQYYKTHKKFNKCQKTHKKFTKND